jgi:hypothetical protein
VFVDAAGGYYNKSGGGFWFSSQELSANFEH